jgi:acyl carrier protein
MNGMQKENNILAKTILAEIFDMPIEKITDDASVDNIDDWDSLAHVQVVTRLEEILNRSLEVDELIETVNLQGIKMVIDKSKNE